MTTDYYTAIAERDAHSAYVIQLLAREAGLTPVEWSKAHPTLTASERAAFETYMKRFDDWARRNPAAWGV